MTGLTRRSFVELTCGSALGVACAGLLASCSPAAQSGKSKNWDQSANQNHDADRVVIALDVTDEPESGFDPLFGWGCGEAVHLPFLQSTLVKQTPGFSFEGDLATDIDVSDDGLTWTFTIRDDVSFTSGQPLTAYDVAFTINGVHSSQRAKVDLSALDAAEAVDTKTAVLHLNRPCNTLLFSLAYVGIVPSDSYDALSYGTDPVGSGPYVLTKYEPGRRIIFHANEGYYGDAPTIKRISILFKSADDACNACYNGHVDIAFTAPRFTALTIDSYSILDCRTGNCFGVSLPTQPVGSVRLNTPQGAGVQSGNAVTSDQVIRQAICCGFDRKTLLKDAVGGYGSVAYSPADGLPWESSDMRVETAVDRAKSMLDDAGWALPAVGGTRVKGSQKAELDLFYLREGTTQDAVAEEIANAFAGQMSSIGISVTTHAASWEEMYENSFTDPVLWSVGNATPADLYDLYSSDGSMNMAGYGTPAIDEYLRMADSASDYQTANALWAQAMWDGKNGVAPQGAATWAWIGTVDHLFFKRAILDTGVQQIHTHSMGWSLLSNVDEWFWSVAP